MLITMNKEMLSTNSHKVRYNFITQYPQACARTSQLNLITIIITTIILTILIITATTTTTATTTIII